MPKFLFLFAIYVATASANVSVDVSLSENASLKQLKYSCENQVYNDCVRYADQLAKVSPNRALPVYQDQCEKGWTRSCARLATTQFELGLIEESLKGLRDGCEKDYKNTCYFLGRYYYQDERLKKAKAYFKKGCLENDEEGKPCRKLGDLLKTENDEIEAKKYYLIACQRGETEACLNYSQILAKNKEYKKAVVALREACEKYGDGNCHNLAFYNANYVNYLQGMADYRASCKNGFKKSCEFLQKIRLSIEKTTVDSFLSFILAIIIGFFSLKLPITKLGRAIVATGVIVAATRLNGGFYNGLVLLFGEEYFYSSLNWLPYLVVFGICTLVSKVVTKESIHLGVFEKNLAPLVFLSALGSYAIGTELNYQIRTLDLFKFTELLPSIINDRQNLHIGRVFTTILLAPILEEVIFRGFLFKMWRKLLSPAKTILITAIVFSLMHFNPSQYCVALVIGVLAGFFRHKTGGLLAPILVHAIYNTLATFLIFIPGYKEVIPFSNKSYFPWSVFLVGIAFFVYPFIRDRKEAANLKGSVAI